MKMKRLFSAILVLTLIFSMCSSAFAADIMPRANPYIGSKSGSISSAGSGKININFNVTAVDIMTTLGANNIKLYKADGTYLKTFYSSSYPNMLGSNTYTYGSSVSYNGVSGESYYAVITYYASCSEGSSTSTLTTLTGKAL